jgi:hypothetical protein
VSVTKKPTTQRSERFSAQHLKAFFGKYSDQYPGEQRGHSALNDGEIQRRLDTAWTTTAATAVATIIQYDETGAGQMHGAL